MRHVLFNCHGVIPRKRRRESAHVTVNIDSTQLAIHPSIPLQLVICVGQTVLSFVRGQWVPNVFPFQEAQHVAWKWLSM